MILNTQLQSGCTPKRIEFDVTDFRKLSDSVLASPQISIAGLEAANALGVTLIVNNRPDGEDPSAPQGADIEGAAKAIGIDYISIPIGHSGFSETQVDQMIAALDQAKGTTLAYCRSGTRSTLLWSLAQAKLGVTPDEIAQSANEAGYDVSPIRPMLDMLAAK